MTSKVFVRFINENQWVKLCKTPQTDEPLNVPDDLFVEWSYSDSGSGATSGNIVSFAEFVDQVHNQWSHTGPAQ